MERKKENILYMCQDLSNEFKMSIKSDHNLGYRYILESESQFSLPRSLQLLCPTKSRKAHINVKSILLIFLTALILGMADLSNSVRLSVSIVLQTCCGVCKERLSEKH